MSDSTMAWKRVDELEARAEEAEAVLAKIEALIVGWPCDCECACEADEVCPACEEPCLRCLVANEIGAWTDGD